MRLKFEHALLVRTRDVLQIAYPGSLVSKILQVGNVRLLFLSCSRRVWVNLTF